MRARNRDASGKVVYDPAEGVDVLKSQIFSFFIDSVEDEDFALLDHAGSNDASTEDDLSTNIDRFSSKSG